MAFVLADRVRDTTTTTGTGTVTLSGTAPTGYQTFGDGIGNGNNTYYTINADSQWEVGIGTYTASGTTLARNTVLASSNGGALVNFAAGTKDVFVTYPSEKAVTEDYGNALAATTAANLAGGAAGSIPYQTAANTTSLLAAGTGVLIGGTTPSYTMSPSLTQVTVAGDPSTAFQVATKQYVDTQTSAGIHFHEPVRVESPINLNATYNNGTAGVGATLTNAGTQAALVIDGVTVIVADRVLIYQQTNPVQNGIYVVTNVGSGSTNWVLTRSSDADTYVNASPDGLSEGSTVFVQQGTTGAGTTYTCNTTGTITFGTTAITFVEISSAQIYSAGTGLTLTGTTFSLTAPVATSLGGTGLTTFTSGGAVYATSASVLTTGTLPATAGGTGQSSYTAGDLLYATSATTLGVIADVATGNALISGGAGADPSYGKIGLTTHISGTLAVGNGGTGATTLTGYLVGNGTSAFTATATIPTSALSGTISLTTQVSGTLGAGNGGTGISSYTVGDILYASGTTTLASLADVATGNALISGGVSNAPLWGKIGLTTHVSGTLPVSNGGSGATTLTGYLKGNGTSAFTASATIPAGDITGAALTKADDTNVTLTLGGSPSTALLAATSITAGWSGQLAVSRGGTGNATLTSNYLLKGNGVSPVAASIIFDNGTNVGVGTASVSGTYGKLTVAGGVRTVDDTSSKLELGRFSAGAPNSYIKLGANSGSLRFTNAADDTDLLTLTNAGNLGVNTSSPGARLETFNDAGGQQAIRMNTNFSGGNYVDLNPFISGVSNGGFSISLNGTIRQVIDTSGNVGIGNSSPPAALSILRNSSTASVAASSSIVLTNKNTAINGTIAGGMFIDTYRDVANPHYSGGIWFTRNQTSGNLASGSDIVFGAMDNNSTSALPSERMRISATGPVTASVDMRAPVYYDSNDTSYYVDPSANSIMGGVFGRGQVRATGWWGSQSASGTGLGVEIGQSGSRGYVLTYNRDTAAYGPMSFEATDFTFTGISGGFIGVNTSVRAPIFYDSNNTGYYVDPASTSRMNNLSLDTVAITSGITGLTSAPITTQYYNIGTTATWMPMTYQRAVYNSGYVTHLNTGLYKNTNGWGSGATGWYAAIGGNDSYPTQAWYLTYDGYIQNSLGYVLTSGSFRAPIFYDLDNTAYYGDFASTSSLNSLIVGTNGSGLAYDAAATGKLYFGSAGGDASTNYHITTNMENVGGNYSKLDFKWYTGQRFYAHYAYGGVRFKEITTGNTLFSVGEGDLRVRAYDSISAPIFYDSANTAYYVDPAASSNLYSATVNSVLVLPAAAGTNSFFVGTGDGASLSTYNFGLSGWNGMAFYNPTVGGAFPNATTGFVAFRDGFLEMRGSLRAPIFYDSNDTGFYVDPATTSVLNQAQFKNRIAIGDGNGTPFLNAGSPGVWLSYNGGVNIFMGSESSTVAGFYIAGDWRLRVNSSGDVTAGGNVTAYSDARIKKDVTTIEGALDLVASMRGVRYTRIDTEKPGTGVIAQEMLEVMPEVVQQGVGDDDTLSVAYGNLVGVLIEAIKELTARVAELEGK
jgi:hypothetical protein